ncbi:hypothetical protein EXIGLDRAFT_388454 [Exidia glandulosa HHB12029]|uniref:Uncharacterized protein n=1 Tax=Exidia glandulosa HHB12029 TaxID=1314781 RepID=A0A165BUK9_EXIGL|nr:hypothetical protein EXIGLDRAFT_388454 [Exidia glandulosa HHB12029]
MRAGAEPMIRLSLPLSALGHGTRANTCVRFFPSILSRACDTCHLSSVHFRLKHTPAPCFTSFSAPLVPAGVSLCRSKGCAVHRVFTV